MLVCLSCVSYAVLQTKKNGGKKELQNKLSQSLSDSKCFSVLDSIFSVDVFSCHGVIVFLKTGFVFEYLARMSSRLIN